MNENVELSEIQRFYKNSTVFLTGATGFVGKLFLEKVLRALPVQKVFILLRSKQGKTAAQRFEDIFKSPAFDLVKRTNLDALKKVVIMEGDCSLPMLGLSQEDQATIIEEVNVVFHVAATVRFEEHLKKATLTNARATRDLIGLVKQITKLKIFVYMGTAFSNCPQGEIKEQVYPSRITAEKLIAACESLDDDCLDSMTKKLIGEWPNTYTFTKQVTEDFINREAKEIPICIIRPTIVVSTMSEPVAAFVDNVYNFVGLVLGNALGVTRISYYKKINIDIVPADLVVNESIAAGWQTGEAFKPDKIGTPVYHISTVGDNPISQDQMAYYCDHNARLIPTPKIVLYPLYFRTTCKYNYLFLRIIFHTFVAYLFDLCLRVQGKKPTFSEAIAKVHKFQESYEYFTTRSLFLHVDNTHKLLKKMTFQDRQLFNCDVTTIEWDNYFSQYARGMRFYILQDTMDTVPEGKKRLSYLRKIFIVSLVITAIVLYVLGKIILFRVAPVIFEIVLYLLRFVVR